jgi:hypothetical protein
MWVPKCLHLLKFYVKLFSIKNRVFWYFEVVLVYKNDTYKELDVCVWSAVIVGTCGYRC